MSLHTVMFPIIRYKFYALLFMCLNVQISAQFFDDFSDVDLTDNPEWMGDLDYYTVSEDGELWMKYPEDESGSAYIYTTTQIPDSIEWNFYFRMDFAPSGSNLLTIYLQLDNPDPNSANGYAISIGESGQNDGIRILRIENGIQEEIARAADGVFGSSPATARLRIIRNREDNWTVFSKFSGDPFFQPILNFDEGEITPTNTSYFGILCKFTKSNRERFFFDDIGLSHLIQDNTGPNISSIEFVDFQKIKVFFDEPLLPESVHTSSFKLISDNLTPISSLIQGSYGNEVLLEFNTPFSNGQEYTLESIGIKDLSGNSADSEYSFQFIIPDIPDWKDLIISEIGAAPNSGNPLPDGEYVELYNRSDKYISLENCILQSGNSSQLFTNGLLLPGEYLIICDNSDQESFEQYGRVLSLSSFPSLSNNADDIVIVNSFGSLIDIVVYDQTWHDNNELADIGHSLELVDTENICDFADNWRTSVDNNGGTPGKENSVLGITPASIPNILKLFPQSNVNLEIKFNQRVELSQYIEEMEISPGNISVVDVLQSDLQGNSWILFLNNPMDSSTIYTLTLQDVQDCRRKIEGDDITQKFGLPNNPSSGDLLFSEILYEPFIDGSEYLEFSCHGESILDASKLYLRFHSSSGSIHSSILGNERLIFPGEYITICQDPFGVFNFYSVENPQNLWISDLPSLTNEGAALSLLADNGNGLIMIDSFVYSPSMHSPLLTETKGTSLERISSDESSLDMANWYSASPASDSGTPTATNSHYRNSILLSGDTPFELQVETFSPDGDGFDDRMVIFYQFEIGDQVISTTIYNLDAHLIKKLDDIAVSGTNGFIYWDGLMEDGRVAPSGVYVVSIETFTLNGERKDFRYSVILATKE